jgi:hypothetical protein
MERLWTWIPAALRAAMAQLGSEPDAEVGLEAGGPVKHERPHLVPLGYVLFFTPMMLLAECGSAWVLPKHVNVPFLALWVPFTVVAVLWSLGLFISHKRKSRRERDRSGL